jgi:acyl transferase domain-containing protein
LSLPGAEAVREVALPAVEAAHAEPAAVGVAVATTAAQVAMARAYAAVGVAPDVVVGHGAGEIAAAVVAGALGFEEALALAAERARVSERLPAWSRVTVLGAPDDVLAVASRHDLVVVAMQAADAWTFAGPRAAVDAACTAWSAVGAAVLAGGDGPAVHAGLGGWPSVPLRPPTQPWASSLVGGRVQQPSATLFAEGFGGPIRFAAALQAAGPAEAVVEIGLLPSLLGLARRTLGASGVTYVPAWARDLGPATWRLSLATLWTRGVAVDWTAAQGPPVRTVALPQTPRRPRRCWVPLV